MPLSYQRPAPVNRRSCPTYHLSDLGTYNADPLDFCISLRRWYVVGGIQRKIFARAQDDTPKNSHDIDGARPRKSVMENVKKRFSENPSERHRSRVVGNVEIVVENGPF